MSRPNRGLSLLLVLAAAFALAGCPSKKETGLDFTKTQREALDRAKAVETTVQDAAARRSDAADK